MSNDEARKARARERARAYYQANREKCQAANAAWRETHREESRAYFRKYRQEHAEAKRAYDREYRATHADRIREYSHERYAANKPAWFERSRLWEKANPEKASARHWQKNQRSRGAPVDATAREYRAVLVGDPCCYCNKPLTKAEVDHIIPLASGGTGAWDNLTASCRSCNAKKHNKSLLEFLMERKAA